MDVKHSTLGIVITALSVVIMPFLSLAERSRRSRAGIGHGPTRHIAGAVVGREEVYSRDNDNG